MRSSSSPGRTGCYNYVAILVGAAPQPKERHSSAPGSSSSARRAICEDAGRHFNRGQRAFFFALGYLGWFLGPVPLALTTTGVVIVMWRRQFRSPSRQAFELGAKIDRRQVIPSNTAIKPTTRTASAVAAMLDSVSVRR